jgi:hypothetical protein
LRERLLFQDGRAPAHSGADVQHWLNAISRNTEWGRGPTEWPPRSPYLTTIDFFLWGHLKEHVYAVPLRIVEDLVAGCQETVTMVDANMSRRVRDNAERSTAFWWMKASWNIYCNYEATMDWSFDSLCHLTVTCIFKTESHGIYVIHYFRLSFKQ